MSASVTRAVASLLLTQGVIGVAHAQTAQLEEIVVTAQKCSQNLQDTPIAISAVTGESIEKLNIDDIGAIAAATPLSSTARPVVRHNFTSAALAAIFSASGSTKASQRTSTASTPAAPIWASRGSLISTE